ncbi:hypothetical protein ACOME3_007490 [Neoechinorhynchus agilis]
MKDSKFPKRKPKDLGYQDVMTEMDIVKKEHRFVWRDSDRPSETWNKRLAKNYYDALFKEYAICDLSHSQDPSPQLGMRWRVEKEVIEGKGQFICGERRCNEREGLSSWEVNFEYIEHGVRKQALVKLRLCERCTENLKMCRSDLKKASRASCDMFANLIV